MDNNRVGLLYIKDLNNPLDMRQGEKIVNLEKYIKDLRKAGVIVTEDQINQYKENLKRP